MVNIEGFELRHREFNKAQVKEMREGSYVLGTGHRQLFRLDRYLQTIIMTDNVSNCLAGVCRIPKGLFVLHDPPMQVLYNDVPIAKRARGKGLIGGSLDHWEATQKESCRGGIEFHYVQKPAGEEKNIDLSFALRVDMSNRVIEYGYYLNPKGPSGDAWLW